MSTEQHQKLGSAVSDSTIRDWMTLDDTIDRSELLERLRRHDPVAAPAVLDRKVQSALNWAVGLGPLTPLFSEAGVTDICLNGPGEVLIDRGSGLEPSGLSVDLDELQLFVERLLDPLGLSVDRRRPYTDARLPDGSRVHVIAAPLTHPGPVVTVRRFSADPIPLSQFGDHEVQQALKRMIEQRANVLITGATGAGKTTLLNALGNSADRRERIVTIEDTTELRLLSPHVVALEARPANIEGVGEVTLRDLVRNALRMRPDRVMVGEVRGPEALDLLLALSSGHSGSLATCHARSASGGLKRLKVLAQLADAAVSPVALDALGAAAIDVVVHVERRGPRREVTDILELANLNSANQTRFSQRPEVRR